MAKKRIYYKNIYVKRRLLQSEIDIFSIIANGLATHTPKRITLLRIKDHIRAIGRDLQLDAAEMSHLWSYALSRYNQISRKTFGALTKLRHKGEVDGSDTQDARIATIYSYIRAYILNQDLEKNANELMYEVEHRQKHDYIYGTGGLLDSATSPFFLASSHPRPAKDHEPYQSKIYIDENWESYVDEAEKIAIRAYIRNHNTQTIQFVTGEGIWLGLRRNCKHYFKNISIDEVLHNSANKLLKKYNMIQKQEAPVSRNVLYYREYYNRHKILESLNKIMPNQQLEDDLKKSTQLMNKWRKLL